jgi:tetratricopeptide (TPR) repeat protein
VAKTPFLSGQTLLILKVLLIAAAGFWIYSPVFHGAWLMDDDLYLPNNPLRHDPAWLWKIWFAPGSFIEYYPIEETMLWVQWHLWGNDTFGYHLTNVVLHIVNALLVWRLLDKLGIRFAWLGGLIFAVHPAMVESVAWISEFKNTLSQLPFLLALCAWLDFEKKKQPRDYFLALLLFLVAMLCKITMAPFPLLILLYAWWKRGRIGWNDLKVSAPFFAISIALGITTVLAGGWFLQLHHTTPDIINTGGFWSRVDRAGLSLAFYFSEFFLPVNMDPMPPLWTIDPSLLRQFLPWPVLIAGFLWFWTQRKSWGRHALLGLGFFVVMIAPFVGIIGASYMKYSWVLDHFLYLPSLGLIALTVATLADVYGKLSLSIRPFSAGIVALVLALFAWESHGYAAVFARPTIFYAYITARNPGSWANHNSLGNALRKEGRTKDAIAQFQEAARLAPNVTAPLNNLGAILQQSHRYAEAMAPYQQAIQIDPAYAEAHSGLGNVLLLSGDVSGAIREYEAALKINPDFAQAHNGLSNALLHAGRLDEALEQSQEALRLAPDYVEAHCNMGLILAQQGKIAEAIAQFEAAQIFSPDDPRITSELQALRAQQENGDSGGK